MTMNRIGHWTGDIHQGDARETLAELPEASVHCVMTSPPYFGLRDYGVEEQIGLEETLDDYVRTIVEIGDELKRVLRDDGSWWLNLGDSFAGSGRGQWDANDPQKESYTPDALPDRDAPLPRKSKMMVPHRVVIALQNAGWVVRSDAVWSKPNPIPHPVKDRLHEHKEFLFHLAPEPGYWFDLDAIREEHKEASFERNQHPYSMDGMATYPDETRNDVSIDDGAGLHPNGKNPGDIIEISVKPFPEAHFAVYPPELCEMPIKASCPPKVCGECGRPYDRVTDEVQLWERDIEEVDRQQSVVALERFRESDLTVEHLRAVRAVGFGDGDHGDAPQGSRDRVSDRQGRLADEAKDVLGGYFREFVTSPEREATGWEQACECATDESEPGIVLDPFAGAGTTALVAKQLGRQFIGIELNEDYVALSQQRIGIDIDDPDRLRRDGEMGLTAFVDGDSDG